MKDQTRNRNRNQVRSRAVSLVTLGADALAVNYGMMCCMSRKLLRLFCCQRVSIGK